MTATENYDLIIVGSGSGNSIPEFLDGWKIAIVERDVFGGTCLNRGCIPSKMFVLPADLAEETRSGARLGIDITFNGADWPAIRDRVFGRIDPISANGRGYRASGSPNVTLIEGTAKFVAQKVIDVDGHTIEAPCILIAVGARPMIPAIEGLADVGYHTSDSIMRLDTLPQRLGIIGGGFIAAEMGHVFAGLGSKVTLINRSKRLLREHDDEIAQRFSEVFGHRVDLRLGEVPRLIERRDGSIQIHMSDSTIEVDELLVATGRTPNSDLLDVTTCGIERDPSGVIVVDQHMSTEVSGVWAIGDVANRYQLKHVANAEAAVAFWNIAHPRDLRSIDYKAVPSAVFSNPQVATVGFTERSAADAGLDFVVGRRDYGSTAFGWALVDDTSFAKVLVERSSELVIGAHIVGPQAATLIQPLVQAMQFGQTAAEIATGQYWIHPALTEVVENALLDALSKLD